MWLYGVLGAVCKGKEPLPPAQLELMPAEEHYLVIEHRCALTCVRCHVMLESGSKLDMLQRQCNMRKLAKAPPVIQMRSLCPCTDVALLVKHGQR